MSLFKTLSVIKMIPYSKKLFFTHLINSSLLSIFRIQSALKSLLYLGLSFCKSRTQLQLEIIFLRKQLEILNRTKKKVLIKNKDRFFFLVMKNIFLRWKENLVIIKPETVIRWHRKRFSKYLRRQSRNDVGRPRIPTE